MVHWYLLSASCTKRRKGESARGKDRESDADSGLLLICGLMPLGGVALLPHSTQAGLSFELQAARDE